MDDRLIAKIGSSHKNRYSAEDEANARLIAAAPDMIDALMQWKRAEQNNDPVELQNARVSRDIAIAKAKEEE